MNLSAALGVIGLINAEIEKILETKQPVTFRMKKAMRKLNAAVMSLKKLPMQALARANSTASQDNGVEDNAANFAGGIPGASTGDASAKKRSLFAGLGKKLSQSEKPGLPTHSSSSIERPPKIPPIGGLKGLQLDRHNPQSPPDPGPPPAASQSRWGGLKSGGTNQGPPVASRNPPNP